MQLSNAVLSVLSQCTIAGNLVTMPPLDRKVYQEVNRALENLGGKWNRGKKAHVFEADPRQVITAAVQAQDVLDPKKDLQFFPTPEVVARQMAELAGIESSHSLLEPSVGAGNLLIEALDFRPAYVVAVDFHQPFADTAKSILRDHLYSPPAGHRVICADFLTVQHEHGFDRVIMNPPFSKQQDVDHVMHAYKMLAEAGVLVAVVSEGVFFRDNKKANTLRRLVEDQGESIQLPHGTFTESGTEVATRIIRIERGDPVPVQTSLWG